MQRLSNGRGLQRSKSFSEKTIHSWRSLRREKRQDALAEQADTLQRLRWLYDNAQRLQAAPRRVLRRRDTASSLASAESPDMVEAKIDQEINGARAALAAEHIPVLLSQLQLIYCLLEHVLADGMLMRAETVLNLQKRLDPIQVLEVLANRLNMHGLLA